MAGEARHARIDVGAPFAGVAAILPAVIIALQGRQRGQDQSGPTLATRLPRLA